MPDPNDVHDNDYLMISDGYYLDELLMMTEIEPLLDDDDSYDIWHMIDDDVRYSWWWSMMTAMMVHDDDIYDIYMMTMMMMYDDD